MARVNPKTADRVQTYLSDLVGIVTPLPNSRSLKWGDLFGFDLRIELLTSLINMPNSLDVDQKRRIVYKAVLRWRRYQQHTLDNFERALETELRHYIRIPLSTHTILFFMNSVPQSFDGVS